MPFLKTFVGVGKKKKGVRGREKEEKKKREKIDCLSGLNLKGFFDASVT